MYINNRHLQILHLIKNNPNFNLKDIENILDMSQQHIKLYLVDIYDEISENGFTPPPRSHSQKIDNILKYISDSKGAKKILRKSQEFTKNQKIFYTLFFLGRFKNIKFHSVSKELDLTTRNLSNYKEVINSILVQYNLKLDISSQGARLIGSNFNLNRLNFFLFFKFMIEKDYLPYKLRKDVLNSLNSNNFLKLNRDVRNLLNLLGFQHSSHQYATLMSIWVSFKGESHEKTIKYLPFDQWLKYKPGHWEKEFFYKVFHCLRESSFSALRTDSLYLLFSVVDTFSHSKVCFCPSFDKEIKFIQKNFYKYFDENTLTRTPSVAAANQWIYYCKLKQLFFIDDFSLINLNLSHISNSNILNMTKEIKEVIPSFTIFEGIFVWYLLSKSENHEEVNIFVFKNLESSLIPSIIDEIYKKHSIKILVAINLKELNRYKKENRIDNIITVENLKVFAKNINIKNLYFPIPNYKKLKN